MATCNVKFPRQSMTFLNQKRDFHLTFIVYLFIADIVSRLLLWTSKFNVNLILILDKSILMEEKKVSH